MSDQHQGEAGEKPAPEPTVDGITSLDFRFWRNQPVTRMFLRYLSDRRTDFIKGAIDRWLGDSLQIATADEMKGWAKCCGEIHDTKHEHIVQFYAQLEQFRLEEEAAAAAHLAGENDDGRSDEAEEERG